VKAYVKRNKNDAADAAAICEAVMRPTMRFVPVKTADQQAAVLLHRGRERLVRQRTALVNALRAHLAEFGKQCRLRPGGGSPCTIAVAVAPRRWVALQDSSGAAPGQSCLLDVEAGIVLHQGDDHVRKLALDLSDGVGRVCSFRASCMLALATRLTSCSAAPSGQAPTPHSGAPKARGLTARTRTERTSVLSR
jgi:transposase